MINMNIQIWEVFFYITNLAQEKSYVPETYNHDFSGPLFCPDGHLAECSILTVFQWELESIRTI